MPHSNVFDAEYKCLRNWTIAVVRNKGLLMPADELINDAYIGMYDKGIPYSHDNIRPFIYNAIRAYYKYLSYNYNDTLPPLQAKLTIGEEKICKGCKQQLPVAFFHILRRYGTGIVTYQSCCKACNNKRQKVNVAKRREDPAFNDKYLNDMKKRQKKKWGIIKSNPRLKEHFSKEAAIRSTRWAQENKEAVRIYKREYKIKNKYKITA